MSITFFYNHLSFYILCVFVLMLVIQLCIHWFRFSKLAFRKGAPTLKDGTALEPVSVVVCARDAYPQLAELLPNLLSQDYPDFEVVVVNDCSEDETEVYLKDLERLDPRVKPVQLRQHLNFFNGKKFPLSMGIKSASHDLLVLTDADCQPTSASWLRSVVSCYGRGTEVVVGYCRYRNAGGLFNLLVRYDAFQRALMYLSAALAGRPYMGIGKNLSYRQQLFFRNKGFTSHYTTAAGDDDVFVSQVATRGNTAVHVDPENTVTAKAPANVMVWLRGLVSRYTTIAHHRRSARTFNALHYWSQFLFYASFVALLLLKPAFSLSFDLPYEAYYYPFLAFLFLLRYLTQVILYSAASRRLGERGLVPGLVVWDFLFAFLTPALRILGRMKK